LKQRRRRKGEGERVMNKYGNILVTGMDIMALYPNLNIEKCAVEMGKEAEVTKLKYHNINETAGILIESNMSQEQVNIYRFSDILPRRGNKNGVRPGAITNGAVQEEKNYN